nr:hypothetical protein [Cellvibrionaceae bacterium]
PESLAGGEDSIPLIKNERSTSRNEPLASPQAENPVPDDLESEWLVAQQSTPAASDSENPDHSADEGEALASSNSADPTDLARAGLSLTALQPDPELEARPSSAAKPFNAPAPGQVLRTYLSTGKKVEVSVDQMTASPPIGDVGHLDLRDELAAINSEDSREDHSSGQTWRQRDWPVKLALGSGIVVGLALVGVLVTVGLKVMVGGFSSKAPDLLAVTSTGREDCEMNYHDGSRYAGECEGKRRDGRGNYQWKSGDSYSGHWKDDKMHGKGVLKYRNGDVYKGSFANNLKHGSGAMDWANGARYKGGYQRGKLHGQGTYWDYSGRRFEGEFQNGATTNNGTCYFVDGTSQAGACP